VFITEQARTMRGFLPWLVGREIAGEPRDGIDYYVPRDRGRLAQLDYVIRRNPALFMSELQRHEPVLIHAHFGVEAVYALEMAERLQVPLVTTFHGFDATLGNLKLLMSRKPSWLNYLLHRPHLQRRGQLFLCVSQFIRNRLLQLGFPAERTRVHYIGVDSARFAPTQPNPDEPLVLHVARLVEQKGTVVLLDAFAEISRRHPQARLVVIGDGPLRSKLRRHAQELMISDRVLWLGATTHEQVRAWLARASVFCLPSYTPASGATEGLGMVLLEAAASGVPTVGTRHGGIPEAVIDRQTGYLVRERSVAELTKALDALLSTPQLCRQLGNQARQMVRSRFDLWTQTAALERHYESVL
jgi:glycosyltransferase involved in cell wall biosynthesis